MYVFFENILIVILTIAVLIGGAYLALVLLSFGLKLKGGLREDEGLVDLWAEVQKQQRFAERANDAADDRQP